MILKRIGIAMLQNGLANVDVADLAESDHVFIARRTALGALGNIDVVGITPGIGFAIASSESLDESEVSWLIVGEEI